MTLAAFTPVGLSPPYINIKREGLGVMVTVRSPAVGCQTYGDDAYIVITEEEAKELFAKALAGLAEGAGIEPATTALTVPRSTN